MASVEERFQAAVNVIKGLPKNGPYQPSTAMMLKFYGLYKQAIEGTCMQKKPPFWDITGRAKWEAWDKNRHLTKEQAMQNYVEALQEIIETMSFNDNVRDFVGSMSGLESINLDELDMVSPGMKELAESHPNSPFNTHNNSPQHIADENVYNQDNVSYEEQSSRSSKYTLSKKLSNDIATPAPQAAVHSQGNVDQSDDEYMDPFDIQSEFGESLIQNTESLREVQTTVFKMNSDLSLIHERIKNIEKIMNEMNNVMLNTKTRVTRNGITKFTNKPRLLNWWPFINISPGWFLVLLTWPFIFRRIRLILKSSKCE